VHHQLTSLWLLLRFTNLNNSKWFQLPFVIEILQICITFCWHYSCEPYPLMCEQIAYRWWMCVQIAYHWQMCVQIAYHWRMCTDCIPLTYVEIAYHWRVYRLHIMTIRQTSRDGWTQFFQYL
jgi:hypothetical protein